MRLNLSTKRLSFVVLAIVWIASNIIWMGCVSAPLPSGKKPVVFRKKSEFAFITKPPATNTHPNQKEVIEKLGQPDEYFPGLKVACYKIDTKTRREVLLLLFVIPIDVYNYQKTSIAMIEYDDSLITKRIEIITPHTSTNYFKNGGLKFTAQKWVQSSKAP